VVVGFGSIASIPAVIFAWFSRARTAIHEQNVMPGLANRLLAWFSDKIALSFGKTRDYFRAFDSKIVVTGNPVRRGLTRIDKNESLRFFGFKSGKATLLVMGGSQGSHSINLGVIKAVSGLAAKDRLQIIHLAGARDLKFAEEAYKGSGIDVRLFSFLEAMAYAYSASDFAISRAGATTVTELAYFSLPAILIPYPYAAEHQAANAGVLKEQGCAYVIGDSQLDGDTLGRALASLLDEPGTVAKMRLNYGLLRQTKDPGDLLADEVMRLNA